MVEDLSRQDKEISVFPYTLKIINKKTERGFLFH